MKILSLNIRENTIEYALYRKISSPFYFLTGDHSGFPGFIRELKKGFISQEGLPSLIGELKKEYKIDCLILGLPFFRFNHHIIDLPLRSEKEIRTALAFELEKRLPFPVEQYIYDFLILKKTEEGSTVLALSIRKEHILNIIEPLKNTGIGIAAITCTFHEEVIRAARKNRGRVVMAEEDGEYIYLACLLDSEIKALRLIRKDEEIEYPSGFQDPAVPKYLLKSLNNPSDERDSRLHNYQTINVNTTGIITERAPLLKFMPEEVTPAFRDIRLRVAGVLSVAAVIIFILTDIVALYKEKRALEYFTDLVAEIKETKSNGPLEERTLLLTRYSEFRSETFQILSSLKKLLPSGTVLSSINIEIQNRTLEIEGKTDRSSSVLQALEGSGLFKNITYSGAVTVKEGKEVFKFRMEIK